MPDEVVLIADDDIQIRRMLSRFLENENCRFFEASNGKEAVDIVRNHWVDLAILDIVMPEMDGVEALKQIKEINRAIQVLIITGHAELESVRQIIFDYGAFDYLLKPFDTGELRLTIRRALREREMVARSDLLREDLENRIAELERDFKEKTFRLRESQIKYRNIVESSSDAILITQGSFVKFANSVVMKSTGYPKEEILNIPFIEFFHPEDRPVGLDRHGKQPWDEKRSSVSTFRLMKKDGSFFWVEDHAAKTLWEQDPAVLHVIRDISERMKIEESLKIKDAALATAISGIGFVDFSGHLTYANKAFCRMWGYHNEDEIVGKSFQSFFKNETEGATVIAELKNSGGYVDQLSAVRKDGATFYVQISASMVTDNSDRPICIMGSFLDITSQKMAEDLMMRTEKLSSLGQLSAGLAHELRNPLAVVSSCSQFCMENLKLDPKVHENLQVIHRNSQRASKLISELLAFARPEQLEQEYVDINEILKNVLRMTRLEVDPGRVAFVQRLSGNLPKVKGDKEKLRQVFLNLVQNAIHAVSGKGTITIESQFLNSNHLLEIHVIDDGPGIPEEYRKQVFDPFFTTKDGGTGLGLSICYSIVEKHMGTIFLEQVEEGGTRICVQLPASADGEH